MLVGCRGETSEQPPVHLIWNMDFQKRFDPQERNAFFKDERAMRTPPAGTIAQGSLEADPAYFHGKDTSGAFVTEFPVEINKALLVRGQARYDIYCAPCHDRTGTGNGVVVQRGMLPPPNFHDERIRTMPVGQIYSTVRDGVRNMPAYGPQIPAADRWAIVAYVRTLQLSQHASKADVPEDVRSQKGWSTP